MQGRGFAFDQCQLTNYETHDQWLQVLLNNITKDVPVGFATVSIEQALRGDKEIFTLMAQEISGSLRASASGVLPMDEKMKALMFDPRVTMHLLPLPKGVAKGQDSAGSVADKDDPDPKPNPKPKKKAKASPKAKAKCPEQLKLFGQFHSNNQPICWSYSLSGCKEAVQNGRCKKGAHICIVSSCKSWSSGMPGQQELTNGNE